MGGGTVERCRNSARFLLISSSEATLLGGPLDEDEDDDVV